MSRNIWVEIVLRFYPKVFISPTREILGRPVLHGGHNEKNRTYQSSRPIKKQK